MTGRIRRGQCTEDISHICIIGRSISYDAFDSVQKLLAIASSEEAVVVDTVPNDACEIDVVTAGREGDQVISRRAPRVDLSVSNIIGRRPRTGIEFKARAVGEDVWVVKKLDWVRAIAAVTTRAIPI